MRFSQRNTSGRRTRRASSPTSSRQCLSSIRTPGPPPLNVSNTPGCRSSEFTQTLNLSYVLSFSLFLSLFLVLPLFSVPLCVSVSCFLTIIYLLYSSRAGVHLLFVWSSDTERSTVSNSIGICIYVLIVYYISVMNDDYLSHGTVWARAKRVRKVAWGKKITFHARIIRHFIPREPKNVSK